MARRGTSRGTGRGTHIFSFETPSRERSGHSANSLMGARELLRDITESDHSPSHRPNSASVTPTNTLNRRSNSNTNSGNSHDVPPETPLRNNSAGLNGSTETTQARLGVYHRVHLCEIFYCCSDVSREIRQLREQQKKLAASSARVEELLQTLTTSKETSSSQTAVPRRLSVSIACMHYI